MSNNIVVLSGWLQIERVQAVDLGQEGARATPVIHAWVYTDKPYLGGKHPVLLSGPIGAGMGARLAAQHPASPGDCRGQAGLSQRPFQSQRRQDQLHGFLRSGLPGFHGRPVPPAGAEGQS